MFSNGPTAQTAVISDEATNCPASPQINKPVQYQQVNQSVLSLETVCVNQSCLGKCKMYNGMNYYYYFAYLNRNVERLA